MSNSSQSGTIHFDSVRSDTSSGSGSDGNSGVPAADGNGGVPAADGNGDVLPFYVSPLGHVVVRRKRQTPPSGSSSSGGSSSSDVELLAVNEPEAAGKDAGIEPKDCFTIYSVSSKEEVDAPESFRIDPLDLSQFFDDDGKIYGYQGLKILVWVSSISFHAYAEVKYESMSDGGKGITDLKLALQRIFDEILVEDKNNFLQTFSAERNSMRTKVADGEILGNIKHLLAFSSIQPAVDSAVSELQQVKLSKRSTMVSLMPPSSTIEEVWKSLKINKKQFLKCWEVLLYLSINPADKYMENFVTFISDRVKAEILERDSGIGGKQVKEVPSAYNEDMSTQASEVTPTVQIDENKANQEEQIQKLVDERVEAIKLIAEIHRKKA